VWLAGYNEPQQVLVVPNPDDFSRLHSSVIYEVLSEDHHFCIPRAKLRRSDTHFGSGLRRTSSSPWARFTPIDAWYLNRISKLISRTAQLAPRLFRHLFEAMQ
jgi:hypothetical protein